MLNSIPLLGWVLDLIVKVSMSIPFWIVWTNFGIGREFFYFLPERYTSIVFWNTVGVFICLGVLKCFSPFVLSQHNTNNSNK